MILCYHCAEHRDILCAFLNQINLRHFSFGMVSEGRKEVFLFQVQQEVGWLFVLAVRLKFVLQNKKKVKH